MKKINWKCRFRNKIFLSSLVTALLLLSNQIAKIFGYDIVLYNDDITQLSETVLLILTMLGIVVDPTTEGMRDKEVK